MLERAACVCVCRGADINLLVGPESNNTKLNSSSDKPQRKAKIDKQTKRCNTKVIR